MTNRRIPAERADRTTLRVRDAVRASWQRSRQCGVQPQQTAPVVADPDEVAERRREHKLVSVWPILSESLRQATTEPGSLLLLTDSEGKVLWAEGERDTRVDAERVHLLPGSLWREDAAGTNGIGMTLALRRPAQIAGPEHYLSAVRSYTCIAAPIRRPDTGDLLGVVDLTINVSERASIGRSLVSMAARLAETRLGELQLREDARIRQRYADRLARRLGSRSAIVTADGRVVESDPPGWLPRRLPSLDEEGEHVLPNGQPVLVERLVAGGPFLVLAQLGAAAVDLVQAGMQQTVSQRPTFAALGRERALLRIDGVTHELSPRHSEIILALLAHPGGLGAETLASEVYGAEGKTITLRAELARLRPILGHRLASQPYRLTEPIEADFAALEHDLEELPVRAVLDRYLGPVLPSSQAPAITAVRERLHARVRAEVFAAGDTDTLAHWTSMPYGRADVPR